MSTGIGNDIAVPHARIAAIKKPYVAAGKSVAGIDFNSPDGKPAHLIFLILTPLNDHDAQIQLLGQIPHIFSKENIKRLALEAENYIKFISIIKPVVKELI